MERIKEDFKLMKYKNSRHLYEDVIKLINKSIIKEKDVRIIIKTNSI